MIMLDEDYNFKDINGKIISLYDDIIWTIDDVLHRSTVIGFDKHCLITDDKYMLYARDDSKNNNIMVIEKFMNFGGIKIK